MTIGVSFDGKHCLNDLGMYLTDADIGLPEPQTAYIDVPGRNGLLDISTALTGEMKYKNRTIKLTFETAEAVSGKEWNDQLSDICNLLHGQTTEIRFDGDDYYYSGRCTVESHSLQGEKQTIKVSCNCDPYKYSITDPSIKSL